MRLNALCEESSHWETGPYGTILVSGIGGRYRGCRHHCLRPRSRDVITEVRGKIENLRAQRGFFCIKTAGRGSLKRGSGQHSFGFPRTSEFGLSPHPDYVLKWRKKPCALLDFAQELCLRGSGFAFLRRAAARVGLSGSGASRFPSEKVLKTALKLPLAYIDSVQYACLPWQKLNLGRGSARWKCWLLAIPRMSMTTFVPRRSPGTMCRS